MAKHKHAAPVAELEPVIEIALSMGETIEDIDAQIEDDIAKPRSVVKTAYKTKYRDRARENGQVRKAAKRSAWDWLASTLAGECLGKKDKINIGAFVAILEANGIEKPLEKWPSQSKGWEGRLRMTGRLALQKIVAESGLLHLADGETLEAPTDWVAKFRS